MNSAKEELETKAETTLRESEMYSVPVNISLLAQRLQILVEAATLGPQVSGLLIANADGARIGYNIAHARVRQRVTIAHELAHYLLHTKKDGKPELFIDKYISDRRHKAMTSDVERREVEANQLGAALLMPGALLQRLVIDKNVNLDDHRAIQELAEQFQVSSVTMANRLLSLNLFC